MKILHTILFSAAVLLSCKPKMEEAKAPEMPANADVSTYEAAIMKIHDETMPKMTDINKFETALRNMRVAATQSDNGSAEMPSGIDDMIASLKASENGMLDWMEYYSAMRAKLQPDVMLEFMKQELQKVTAVQKNVNETIDNAKAWLAAHPS